VRPVDLGLVGLADIREILAAAFQF
jgi:hypothetical protein